VPAVAKLCDGFCWLDGALPSPKFHDHDVGVFVDVSVNVTADPTVAGDGDIVKFAVGAGVDAGLTVICLVTGVLGPPALVAVKLTV
jgi:hypothetical protein